MATKQNFEGKCCYVCGHEGWKQLLIGCTVCNQLAIHKYCLGITPGSDEYKYWRCYYCSPESMDSSFNSEHNSDIYQDNSQIVLVTEQPKPLRIIFPKEHHKSTNQEEAAEITRGVVLIVSPTGEAIIRNEIDTSVSSNVSKKVVKKVKGSCNNETYGEEVRRRSERVMQKLNVIGLRRSPRFKRPSMLHGSKRIRIC